MCEYCKLLSGDRKILEEDGETEVRIGRVNKDYYIEAENNCDYIDIDINYCPFCGKKLNKQNICADEMFENLGYEKKKVHLDIQLYEDKNSYKEIVFDLRDRTISVTDATEEDVYFDIKELQAINKKVEELGWKLEEKN